GGAAAGLAGRLRDAGCPGDLGGPAGLGSDALPVPGLRSHAHDAGCGTHAAACRRPCAQHRFRALRLRMNRMTAAMTRRAQMLAATGMVYLLIAGALLVFALR